MAMDDGEWIKWGGGELPVNPGTPIDVRYRNGEEHLGVMAGKQWSYRWSHEQRPRDITWYRKTPNAKVTGSPTLSASPRGLPG